MEQTQERTISLQELIKVLFKHWYIIAVTTVLGIALGVLLGFYVVTPKYKSTAEILVQGGPASSTGEYTPSDAVKYIATIEDFLKTDIVINHAIEAQNLQPIINKNEIKSGLSVKTSTTSLVVKVSYLSTDYDLSKVLVNAIVDSAKEIADTDPGIKEMLGNTFMITTRGETGEYDSPNKVLYIVVGLLLGGIAGVATVLIIDFSRMTYRSKEEIESEIDIPVIGVIPKYEVK